MRAEEKLIGGEDRDQQRGAGQWRRARTLMTQLHDCAGIKFTASYACLKQSKIISALAFQYRY